VRQFGRQAGDAVQHALPQGTDAPLQGEGLREVDSEFVYPDLAYLVTARGTGLYRRDDGRYAFACSVHGLRSLWTASDPQWLKTAFCLVCEAERLAVAERRLFREELRHGC